jgi:hypothetical protein
MWSETWLERDNWVLFREILRGDGDIDRYISDLSRPDALKASLNWYRANLAPRLESGCAKDTKSPATHVAIEPAYRCHAPLREEKCH